MMLKRWTAGMLSLCLALSLGACGAQANPVSPEENISGAAAQKQESETLTEYTVEGIGVFHLPEGFTQEQGEFSEPLPAQYATFEKDGYYIQVNRFGLDAYEAAGVPLPADVEEYATRSGVQDSVPEGTQFSYDSLGNYCAQFTQEDGTVCYYVLLQGTESFGNIFLSASEDVFDPETAALWLNGSELE